MRFGYVGNVNVHGRDEGRMDDGFCNKNAFKQTNRVY